ALGVAFPTPARSLLAVPVVLLASMGFPVALVCASVLIHTVLGIDVDAQDVAEAMAEARGWELAAIAVYVVVLSPLFEGLQFRGLGTGAIEHRLTPRAAAAASAVVFASFHDTGSMLPVFGTGYLLGLLRINSGGLGAGFALHSAYNLLMVVLTVAAGRA